MSKKFGFEIASFVGSYVGVRHQYGNVWGKLGQRENRYIVGTPVDPKIPCEIATMTEFTDADIDDAEIKGGTLYIHLATI